MAPHKEALRSLLRSAMRDPGLALALNAMAVRSQQWMLTAADIPASGPRGMVRAQGLALLFARVLRTFVDDDDEGHARTMAALDRELARGARWVGLLDDLCRFVPRCRRATAARPRTGRGRRGGGGVRRALRLNRPGNAEARPLARGPPRPHLHRQGFAAGLIEQRTTAVDLGAFDREQAQLGVDAARRREAAGLAAGRDHAMARHHGRKRIFSQRLSDRRAHRRAPSRAAISP